MTLEEYEEAIEGTRKNFDIGDSLSQRIGFERHLAAHSLAEKVYEVALQLRSDLAKWSVPSLGQLG